MDVIVAIDCMGGDRGPPVTVAAALDFLQRDLHASVILIGLEDEISEQLHKHRGSANPRLKVYPATEVVGMDEPPAIALRSKKDSSMRAAIDLVKEGVAHACVSAGNTGALMAISRFVLKMLPGIDRPVICAVLPTVNGQTYMLDLGANVDCSAEHLLQFGIMGAMLVSAIENKERPTIGLLNVGAEEIKGGEVVKQAGNLLRNSGLNFYGNIEGDDIYKGTTDVVVCDGFVGNVALKVSEGLIRMLAKYLRQEFHRNLWTRIAGVLALPAISAFKRRVDPSHYNGATLLGLRGIVIKSHGSADRTAFRVSIQRAADEARSGVLTRITERVSQLHEGAA